MARKSPHPEVSRRKFLAGVAVAGAASTVAAPSADAAAPPVAAAKIPSALRPTAKQIAAETELPKVDSPLGGRAGSDFMIDVIKSLGIEYCYANPASSYRGIHESLINYGKNTMPEFITCMHEESAIAMAHGYFKVTGKPALSLCHGVVGLMHGTMSIYNAWVDRAPVIVVGGTDLDAANRPPGVPTIHSGQDINALVRDFTKWDDTPVSLPHFAQSMVRAYKFAMTPPYEPVMIALDAELQEMPVQERERNRLIIPKYTAPSPPQAEVAALRETAKLLVNAERPVIVADRVARTPDGLKHLVELAELLQAPVVNMRGRMNFPSGHHLSQPPGQLYAQADLILGLEVGDFWNVVNGFTDNADNEGLGDQRRRAKPDAKLITISSVELNEKSNYQDFQRFQPVDIAMVGDAEASLPSLIEAVKMAMSNDRKAAYDKRGEDFKKAKATAHERAMAAAAVAWDASPDLHRTNGGRALGRREGSRLGAGRRQQRLQRLAGALLQHRQALSVDRRLGRRRTRLWHSGGGRGCARPQGVRSACRRHRGRWRLHVCPGRVVDRGTPPDSAAGDHPQQSRLPSGGHARAAPVQPAQPARQQRQGLRPDRHPHRKSEHRLCDAREIDGRAVLRAGHRSGRARSNAQEGGASRQGR